MHIYGYILFNRVNKNAVSIHRHPYALPTRKRCWWSARQKVNVTFAHYLRYILTGKLNLNKD